LPWRSRLEDLADARPRRPRTHLEPIQDHDAGTVRALS
jgi:hypothetical protein